MKKGFTLIELLAVIVILAIIALIATPIILGIINDARDEAEQRTGELISSSVELAYTGYLFAHDGNKPADLCAFMKDHFEMDGATLGSGDTLGTCTAGSNTVDVTVSEDVYTVTYADGAATISGKTNVGTKYKNITVKLATK